LRLARDTPAYSMAGTIVYAVFTGVFGGFFFGLVVSVVMRGRKSNEVGLRSGKVERLGGGGKNGEGP